MSRIKRMLGLGVVAGLLAALAMAIPAQAAGVKGACVAVGYAKTTDNVNPALGVRLVGGTGKYLFDGLTVVCAGSAKGTPTVVVVDADSPGDFTNTVCGTGQANNNAANVVNNVTEVSTAPKGTAFWSALVAGLNYSVEFVATNGVMFIDQADTLGKDVNVKGLLQPDNKGAPQDYSDYDLAGSVKLLPPVQGELQKPGTGGPDPSTGNCTKAFDVVAVFKVDL